MENILNADKTFFLYINNSFHNSFFDSVFTVFNLLGNWWYLSFVCIGLIYFYSKKDLIKNLLLLIACAVVSGILLHLLKWILARPRPLREFEVLIAKGKVIVYVLGERLQGSNSFPSGHTQTIFCATTFLYYLFEKKYFFILFFISIMVGIARIYLGAHFPLDVLGGAIIGIVPTIMVLKIYEKKFNAKN